MNICSEHNIERKWIYMFQKEPLPAKPVLESKFECWECHKILMKTLGWETEKKKHGRRRKKN